MDQLEVKLKRIGDATGNAKLYVTIDGRQALAEGPRRIGHCCYCKRQCIGVTVYCDPRVYAESTGLKR